MLWTRSNMGIFGTWGSQDNVIGNATFPICDDDNYEEFNQIKYSNFAKYLAFFMFQQQI